MNRPTRWRLRRVVPHLAAVLALGWWAIPLTRAGAGVDAWSLGPAVLACLPLLMIAGARHLRPIVLLLALLPGASALLLNFTSRTGWSGLDTAASWLYAGLLGLGVLAYARTPRRRLLVVTLLGVGALDQFGQGWLAWWGGGDVTALMSGTMGWHNPFAAFVAAPLVIGWCLVMRATGPERLGAALVIPWLGAGVLLSGSRATIGLVVLAGLALMVFAARTWGEAARLAAAAASAPLAVWVLSSSWLMPLGSAVTNTALGRDEAAAGNFTLRGHYAWAGLRLAGRHLLMGAGFDSYGPAGAQYMPPNIAASDFVHNGWIQALVDGGLILAVPVVVVTGWPALRAIRRVIGGRRAGANAIQLGASLAVLVLLGHALFDVDWNYPSLLALYAMTIALLPWRSRRVDSSTTAPRVAAAVLVGVACLTIVTELAASVVAYPQSVPPAWGQAVNAVIPFRSAAADLHTSAADGLALLHAGKLDPAEFAALMARTQAAAQDDPSMAQARALALASRGQVEAALVLSSASLPVQPRPPVVVLRGEVLAVCGRYREARQYVLENRNRIQALQGNVPTTELDKWLASHPSTGAPGGSDGRTSTGGGVG